MKAIVLLSGGIDSAVALWDSLRNGMEVEALTFNYHRRPPGEVRALSPLAEAAGGLKVRSIDLPTMREVVDLPPPSNPSLRDAPEGYIPARNLIFYAMALGEAEARGADYIIGGHNGGDSEVFPDASRPFFNALNRLARLGLWSYSIEPIEIRVPLAGMTKAEVIRLGGELGVPFELTWSCYWDRQDHCGVCESCRERRDAFAAVGVEDPTTYAVIAENWDNSSIFYFGF